MSSLTEDAVYTFGENEEVDDKIVAQWIRIVGEKTSNIQNGEVKVNDKITYAVTLRNEGTVDGRAIINDDTPVGTQFVENSIKINDEETQYTLEDLKNGIEVDVPLGGETKLTFDVLVNDLNDDDLISNTAHYKDITVTGKETEGETNQVDLTYVEPIIGFNKKASKENGDDYVVTDEKIKYQIIVQNAGGLAKDVIVQDVVPEGTTFVDGSIKINDEETQYTKEDLENGIQVNVPKKISKQNMGTESVSDVLRLANMKVLDANSLPGEIVLTFEVTVDDQKDENIITNIAQVDGEQTNQIEYTYRKPIISSEKLMKTENNLDYAVSKENIEYSIVVENAGSITKNVSIKDVIPEGTTFMDGSIKIDGEETDFTDEDLEEGIVVEVPQKHIKEDDEEDGEQEETPEDVEDNQQVENPEENGTNEEVENSEEKVSTLSDDGTNIEDKDEDDNLEGNQDDNVTDDENTENTDNEEKPNEDEEQREDANLQENEEPGKVTLTFNVIVDDLEDDTKTLEITNIAIVDGEETNETSIEVLPFNMKVETEIEGFTANGTKKESSNPKFAKTDIDMRKSSPTPDVTANIKIKVTNTGKVSGTSVVEATIPEGFTLVSSEWKKTEDNLVRIETEEIEPGKTQELALDVKWNNDENNLGERNTKAEIIETSNEARAAETSLEDNESEADMIIGIVTGEYDNIIILTVIGIVSLVAIIGEIVLIKKYIL